MYNFFTSLEGVSLILIGGVALFGAISELRYFNSACNRLKKRCNDLQHDINRDFGNGEEEE